MVLRRFSSALAAALVVVACSGSQEARESDATVAAEQRAPTIEHVTPARDAVGPAPTRLEWTATEGAHEYAVGIWDDVDRLIWSDFHVRGTSVTLTKDVTLDFGTYFWSVTALHDGRPVAESGRSAFVVTR